MVNPESSLQLQRLLAMLKDKALETSIERDRKTSGEIPPTTVAKKAPAIVNLEVSSRLQRLLEILINKTVDGLAEWKEQVRDQLFSASIGRFSFTVEFRHDNVASLLSFGMYNFKGVLVSRVTSADEQYPEAVQEKIRELWTTVSTRASHLVSFLDQALNALEDDPPCQY